GGGPGTAAGLTALEALREFSPGDARRSPPPTYDSSASSLSPVPPAGRANAAKAGGGGGSGGGLGGLGLGLSPMPALPPAPLLRRRASSPMLSSVDAGPVSPELIGLDVYGVDGEAYGGPGDAADGGGGGGGDSREQRSQPSHGAAAAPWGETTTRTKRRASSSGVPGAVPATVAVGPATSRLLPRVSSVAGTAGHMLRSGVEVGAPAEGPLGRRGREGAILKALAKGSSLQEAVRDQKELEGRPVTGRSVSVGGELSSLAGA
ncbi:unnamed protein product, partial [Scytosiphon promiscuus]